MQKSKNTILLKSLSFLFIIILGLIFFQYFVLFSRVMNVNPKTRKTLKADYYTQNKNPNTSKLEVIKIK